ncbi:hypothetical protein [Streptosporangium sp. NPDC006007]|uniref:hypothetical protein n=1 Tax=Streptosporangium sp. NPDC006007 TaxID=3154575 RepID=UPI0033A2AD22
MKAVDRPSVKGTLDGLPKEFDIHTLLCLPIGIFYAGGVKADVRFFDKKSPRTDNRSRTSKLWIYDFRNTTNNTYATNSAYATQFIPLELLTDLVDPLRPPGDR